MEHTSNTSPPVASAVVIGGGITGLVAARSLSLAGVPDVTLLESSDQLGGKLRTITIDGVALELGADSFLAAKPEAVALANDLGVELVAAGPMAGRTYLLRDGRLRPLPKGLAMGVPTGLGALIGCVRDGLIGPIGAARAGIEPLLPAGDRAGRTVADVTRARLGRQVADRLIAPLVGGVFGAPPDEVGFNDVFPHLADQRSLVLAMARRPTTTPGTPTFMTVREGLQHLVDRLVADLEARNVRIRTTTTVTQVRVDDDGVQVRTTGDGSPILASCAVIATEAPTVADLLVDSLDATTAADLRSVSAHPSAVFLLRYAQGSIARELDGGGYLVAPSDHRVVAACTWLPTKWPHHPWGDPWIRAIVTDPAALSRTDDDLAAVVASEVGGAIQAGAPLDVRIHRWDHAIPVFSPGHRQRMRAALKRLPDRVQAAGAAFSGPGIPDCIRGAQEASQELLRRGENPL